ncbi:MAG: hypothetical protein JSS07_03195 [Proteobacteria bacterium]|nr:hypothetical protein [Pseudomonadota bacterium]
MNDQKEIELFREFKNSLETEFELKLYQAALNNLNDNNNKIRFNNFAYSVRELIRNILERRAPNDQVVLCSWYQKPKDTLTLVTRRQRIMFIIHGGLSERFISDNFDIDMRPTIDNFIAQINNLSKFTHIEKNTFEIANKEIQKYTIDFLESVNDFFKKISESRKSIIDLLESDINEMLYQDAFSESITELLEIATHHSIDSLYYESDIIDIDEKNIYIAVSGSIDAELWWGKGEDEVVMSENFPFQCMVYADVKNPKTLSIDKDSFNVNTSSWSQ